MSKEITPRATDFSKWYQDVVHQASLAEHAPVKGCMIIRPYGYALWERIQQVLDGMIKATGHQNAYFPLFIPESFLKKEAEHVAGFAPECAVVTHGGGKKLEEPLIVRPTSETIINHAFSTWVDSWRDLPLLINQWANVVRWEMRPRLFLRTLEFLWQEGHTAHRTHEESNEEVLKMLGVYRRLAEETLAISVVTGRKTATERFAGADETYTLEAMMQNRWALQAGTSHDLGQHFAKAFNITFQDQDGQRKHVWQTSWGVSTRLIGAVVMSHSDDQGLVLPPRLAPIQAVLVPIYKKEEERAAVLERARAIGASLANVRFHVDERDQYTPGAKFFEWEKKGVPLRLELGPRDLAKSQVVVARRDTGEKTPVAMDALPARLPELLEAVQAALLERNRKTREAATFRADTLDELRTRLEGEGGWFAAPWCGKAECEAKVKQETMATIRCIPLDNPREAGRCLACGGPSPERVLFARNF